MNGLKTSTVTITEPLQKQHQQIPPDTDYGIIHSQCELPILENLKADQLKLDMLNARRGLRRQLIEIKEPQTKEELLKLDSSKTKYLFLQHKYDRETIKIVILNKLSRDDTNLYAHSAIAQIFDPKGEYNIIGAGYIGADLAEPADPENPSTVFVNHESGHYKPTSDILPSIKRYIEQRL
jgi:hypothetical protein